MSHACCTSSHLHTALRTPTHPTSARNRFFIPFHVVCAFLSFFSEPIWDGGPVKPSTLIHFAQSQSKLVLSRFVLLYCQVSNDIRQPKPPHTCSRLNCWGSNVPMTTALWSYAGLQTDSPHLLAISLYLVCGSLIAYCISNPIVE